MNGEADRPDGGSAAGARDGAGAADRRIFFVGMGIAFMTVVVMFVGPELFDYRPAPTGAAARTDEIVPSRRDVAAEAEPMRKPAVVPAIKFDADPRTLAEYEERRAYPGAPPAIPHAIDWTAGGLWQGGAEQAEEGGADWESGGRCAACHIKGGYVPRFNAYAPVTPHPNFPNCRQCHVPRRTDKLFRETEWASVARSKTGLRAMPGAPPAIPHSLQMRENCLACHFGPASVVPSSHPERGNCRQCHVPRLTETTFARNDR